MIVELMDDREGVKFDTRESIVECWTNGLMNKSGHVRIVSRRVQIVTSRVECRRYCFRPTPASMELMKGSRSMSTH